MHERTRRAISRMLFVFCCALPTFFTTTAIAWTWTPWAHRRSIAAAAADITAATGAVVSLGDIRTLSPGHTRIDALTLTDPETGGQILKIRSLQTAGQTSAAPQSTNAPQNTAAVHPETALVAQQPELQSATLPIAWRLFEDRFLRRPELSGRNYRIAANDLTLHSPTHSITLRDVDAWIESDDQSITGNLSATISGRAAASPILISIRRQRGDTPTTTWTLQTGPHRLPMSIVAQLRPGAADWFGPDATISGHLQWTDSAAGPSLDLSGCRIDDVALDRLMADSPHRLSGRASITLQRGRIDPGHHIDAAGRLTAADGRIGDELLLAAATHLDCQLPVQIPPGDLPFDNLAIHFQINDTQMRIDGIARTLPGYETLPPGIALIVGRTPVLQTPAGTLPTIRLVSLLAPRHATPVPLATQNHTLAKWLLPPDTPPLSAPPTPPKIRTATAPQGGPLYRQP